MLLFLPFIDLLAAIFQASSVHTGNLVVFHFTSTSAPMHHQPLLYLHTTDPPPRPSRCQMWLRSPHGPWWKCDCVLATRRGDSGEAQFNKWVIPKRSPADVCFMTCEGWFLRRCRRRHKRTQADKFRLQWNLRFCIQSASF